MSGNTAGLPGGAETLPEATNQVFQFAVRGNREAACDSYYRACTLDCCVQGDDGSPSSIFGRALSARQCIFQGKAQSDELLEFMHRQRIHCFFISGAPAAGRATRQTGDVPMARKLRAALRGRARTSRPPRTCTPEVIGALCPGGDREPNPERTRLRGVAGIFQVSPEMIASWKPDRGPTIPAAEVPMGQLRESARREVLQGQGSVWT